MKKILWFAVAALIAGTLSFTALQLNKNNSHSASAYRPSQDMSNFRLKP